MCVCVWGTDRQTVYTKAETSWWGEWMRLTKIYCHIVYIYIQLCYSVGVKLALWIPEIMILYNAWLGNSPGWLMVLCSVMSHGSDNITFWHCNLYIYIYVLSCLVSHCFSQFLGLALVGFVQPLRVLENPWVLKTHFQVYSRPLKLVKTRHGAWQSLKIEIALLLWSVLIVTAFSPSLLSQVFMT